MMNLRIPYPETAASPVWNEPNAPHDFCEENYIITSWIAEFINTLTNIAYIIYAAHGVRKFWSHNDFWSRTLSYWGIAGVGVTSALFHGTLRKWPQFSDDLSMLVATGIVFHRILSYGKTETQRRNNMIAITSSLTVASIYHCWAAETAVHNIAFLGMVAVVARQTRLIIRERTSDQKLRRELTTMAKSGSYFFIGALIIWLIDQKACSYLQQIRDIVGLPWGFLFELHGWWHILTAIGVYDYFVLVEIVTGEGSIEQNLIDNAPFAWPVSLQLGNTKRQ